MTGAVSAADLPAAVAGEPAADRTVFLARARRHLPDLRAGLAEAYGEDRADEVCGRALGIATAGFLARPADLRLLDLRRHVEPDWFQRPDVLGYAAYTERFAGDLRGVADRIPYLRELGVTYLHLMPLLAPRPAPNDGGYAVADFRRVRPDLGTMEDLAALAAALRAEGISLTLDLVLNHVAREHPWAEAARAGDEHHRAYFHLFPDRTMPDAHEATLPEVFPDFAPGSFTWDDELAAWVWTTFNAWQWDLDWGNPDVFCELADVVCFLANQGVECLRLDAIAFLWKRLGTTSQNQPEVHALIQALRAVARIAAPALVMKAEAIVGPDDLLAYLGTGRHHGKLSDLAYHNALMVHIWSALATSDARLMSRALRRFAGRPASTAWATYLRGHDDIGWAIDDGDPDAASLGWDGAAHRSFLSDWYAGEFPGSTARGLVFQHNVATGDRRISGTAASLAGLEHAIDEGDEALVDEAVARLLLAHAITFGEGGVPVLYMGDELALRNDHGYRDVAEHAGDNRWVHRPLLPLDAVERRHDRRSVEHRTFTGLRDLARARAGLAAMHAAVPAEHPEPPVPGVHVVVRPHPGEPLVALYNVTSSVQVVPVATVREALGGAGAAWEHVRGADVALDADLHLTPYATWWLTAARPG